jgi:small conductance mechanosensitive channel
LPNGLFIAVIGALIAFVVGEIVIRLFQKLMGRAFARFVANMLRLAIAIWTIKVILDISGAAGLALVLVTVLTGAFTLGSERFASDIISGVKLFTTRPYIVGDHVQIAGYEGLVTEINLSTTFLESVSGDRVILRNADVMDNTIINQTDVAGQMIAVMLPVPYGEDLELATQVILDTLKNHPDYQNDRYEPSISIDDISYGYVKIQVRAFVSEKLDYGPDRANIVLRCVAALKAQDIKLKG